jgi:chromosome segregation ATPase
VRELRRTLEELRHEKELADAKADRVQSLEELVNELRQANRSLEEKITRLCEAPFIGNAFGQQETKMKYEDLAREREELISKIEHLQEAVRTHYSALTSLKQHAAQLRQEKEKSDKKAEDLQIKLMESQSGTHVLQDKLKIYANDDDIDMETLEKALTLIKRRNETAEKLPFLEDPENEKLITLPAMKRKLEDVQMLNLKLSEECERLENMLKLQSGISRDLHKELESIVRAREKDKKDLLEKADSFEEIALKRLDKIHALEAQVRQFVYGLAKNSKKNRRGFQDANELNKFDAQLENIENEDDNNVLLSELIDEKGSGDIRPDENLLEIWIKEAVVKDGIVTPGSSTFVVIDFFDYESQTTSLLSTTKPQWDFAATYKIIIDDFLLRYLATDVVTLELNMVNIE